MLQLQNCKIRFVIYNIFIWSQLFKKSLKSNPSISKTICSSLMFKLTIFKIRVKYHCPLDEFNQKLISFFQLIWIWNLVGNIPLTHTHTLTRVRKSCSRGPKHVFQLKTDFYVWELHDYQLLIIYLTKTIYLYFSFNNRLF